MKSKLKKKAIIIGIFYDLVALTIIAFAIFSFVKLIITDDSIYLILTSVSISLCFAFVLISAFTGLGYTRYYEYKIGNHEVIVYRNELYVDDKLCDKSSKNFRPEPLKTKLDGKEIECKVSLFRTVFKYNDEIIKPIKKIRLIY